MNKYQLTKIVVVFAAVVCFTNTNILFAQDGETAPMKTDSILLKPWIGPYGGVPPWRQVNPAEFLEAFDAAIEISTNEIDAITNNPEPANFENTFVALEQAGQTLERVNTVFDVHASNLNIGAIPDIEKAVGPKLSAHFDSITQNKKLFERIQAAYQSDEFKTLTVAQQRLAKDRFEGFVRRGAKLDAEQKSKLSQINSALAGLFTNFSQNILKEEGGHVTWIDNEESLAGLPGSTVSAMANSAKGLKEGIKVTLAELPDNVVSEMTNEEKGLKEDGSDLGDWSVTNTRSSMEPFLTYASNRELREKVWRTYYSRGDNGGEYDTNEIITAILKLRAERALLLGYETHAHWRLEPQMAAKPETAMALMMKVWPKAVARVKEEVADMQTIADKEGANITIEPWDYRYYAEKVRKDKYDLDFNEVKPYLQLEKLREGMMWAAGELYGFEFKQVSDVPTFHPDVRVWEVSREGNHVGLWVFDPFARRGKRSGAWMNAYRVQKNIDSPVTPIVSNNSNFIKGNEGEAVLISWDDALTLFHEFGHALHGLCSNAKYPSQAGTSVARDYVEFPSQLNEHWLSTPEILAKFAVHFETGEPMPKELLDKIEKAETFNQGFGTVEYLASALIDMKLHLAGNVTIDPDKFEKETLVEIGMPKEIVMRHRTPHFSHVFSSDGYSAGYYSYLWSDALTADAAEVFDEAGSYYDSATAKSLHDNIMSVGDTIDPAEGFRKFRGRDVDTKALLRKRGFPVD